MFGPERVFTGGNWSHAFPVHSKTFYEAAVLTEAVIFAPDGLIPLALQNVMLDTDCSAIISRMRSFVSAIILFIWIVCATCWRVLTSPGRLFTSASK